MDEPQLPVRMDNTFDSIKQDIGLALVQMKNRANNFRIDLPEWRSNYEDEYDILPYGNLGFRYFINNKKI